MQRGDPNVTWLAERLATAPGAYRYDALCVTGTQWAIEAALFKPAVPAPTTDEVEFRQVGCGCTSGGGASVLLVLCSTWRRRRFRHA